MNSSWSISDPRRLELKKLRLNSSLRFLYSRHN